jgi:hypothetical protein
VPYYHAVFTLPAPIADIAYTNKSVIYDALFKAASETLLGIAKLLLGHLGRRFRSAGDVPSNAPGLES